MNDHLDLNLLARLAEGDFDDLTPAQRRHLAACRQCQDAVVETASVLAEAADVTVPTPPRTRDAVLNRTTPRPRRVAWRRPVSWAAVPMAAALAWLLVAAPWDPSVDPALTGPVGQALSNQAVTAMVFPGAPVATGAAPTFRGGDDPAVDLVQTVDELTRAYNDDHANPDLARWLLGAYLAVNDLRTAELFARDAVRRHGRDAGVLAAAGVVAYRAGHFEQAADLLAGAAAIEPDRRDLRYNRAILALASGHQAEAAALLQGLRNAEGDPLAGRAAELLNLSTDNL